MILLECLYDILDQHQRVAVKLRIEMERFVYSPTQLGDYMYLMSPLGAFGDFDSHSVRFSLYTDGLKNVSSKFDIH